MDKLKVVEKFVIFLGIFKCFVCVWIFNGNVFVFECEVNVKISIFIVFFMYLMGLIFKIFSIIKWIIYIVIRVVYEVIKNLFNV